MVHVGSDQQQPAGNIIGLEMVEKNMSAYVSLYRHTGIDGYITPMIYVTGSQSQKGKTWWSLNIAAVTESVYVTTSVSLLHHTFAISVLLFSVSTLNFNLKGIV